MLNGSPLAKADAERAACPNLIPMLEGLAKATERLRAADWNDNADQDPSTRRVRGD